MKHRFLPIFSLLYMSAFLLTLQTAIAHSILSGPTQVSLSPPFIHIHKEGSPFPMPTAGTTSSLSSYISQQQAYQYAASAGFTDALVPGSSYTQLQTIVAIAGAESGYNTRAYNPKDPYGGSYGILQINGVHFGSGKGMSPNGAYDPSTAFKYAYSLSGGGVNFQPWTSYTNGNFKKFLPPNPKTAAPQKLPANGWWNFPRVDNYGSPDPYGGFPKPDSNILVPDNYPILNLLPGTVSGINSPSGTTPEWGAVLTIKLDKPINNLATHEAYLHLAQINPNLKIGDHVDVGALIGYNGGNNAAGAQKVPLGFALTPVDFYGFGAQWVQTDGNPLLNPVPLLDAAKSGNLSSGQLSTISAINTKAPVFDPNAFLGALPKINLGANADVVAALIAFDELLAIYSPFPTLQQDPNLVINFLGVQMINPFQWFIDVILNIMQDIVAITLRILFFGLGAFVIFKVFDRFTNFTANAGSVAQTGLQLAALAA